MERGEETDEATSLAKRESFMIAGLQPMRRSILNIDIDHFNSSGIIKFGNYSYYTTIFLQSIHSWY